MWNNEDSTYQEGGGGFNNTTNMFSSPSAASSAKGNSKIRAVAPVAIKQIIDCPEDGLKIRDVDVQVVKVVGIIKAVEKSTIKIMYTVEDPTGVIDGITYIESENEAPDPVIENTYCVVIGSIRSQAGSKHIMVFNIYPVHDFNEIIEHYLHAIYVNSKIESMDSTKVEDTPIKQEMLSSYGSNMNSGKQTEMNYYDMNPNYRKVYQIVAKTESESGISTNEIFSALGGRMTRDQFRKALDNLVEEGHIFTTIDDQHYKSTESPF